MIREKKQGEGEVGTLLVILVLIDGDCGSFGRLGYETVF